MRLTGAKSFMASFPVSGEPNRLSPSGLDFNRIGLRALASLSTSTAVTCPEVSASTSIAQRAGT
jgi:hypothetical protein